MNTKRIVGLTIAVIILTALGALLILRLEAAAPEARYSPAKHPVLPTLGRAKLLPPYEPGCQRPTSRDDADLCAQWAAVEAVNQGNSLTRLSIWLTFFEFVALTLSLVFAAWAAIASSRAARASERALAVSEESAQLQLRPYVFMNDTVLEYFDKEEAFAAHVLISVQNFGATPAYDVGIRLFGELVSVPMKDADFTKEFYYYGSRRRLAPHNTRQRWVRLSRSQLQQIEAGTHALLIKAEVTYKTGSGSSQAEDYDRIVTMFDRSSLQSLVGRVPQPHDFASGGAGLYDEFIGSAP